MTELQIHGILVWAILAIAAPTFVYLLRNTAPFGRHYPVTGWGPSFSNRMGWIVMELPTVVVFLYVFFCGKSAWEVVPLVFLVMWQVHYLHRTLIYPFRTRTKGKRMPIAVAASGFFFNVINAYINARVVSEFAMYSISWLGDPRFLAGLGIFLFGMALNLHSDTVLLRLRKPGGNGYSIPQGGGFRLVTCPNYLGEILEWVGWALATWSLAGLAFFVFTAANLVPRAYSHHRWYRVTFEDYPTDRKAVIPGVF